MSVCVAGATQVCSAMALPRPGFSAYYGVTPATHKAPQWKLVRVFRQIGSSDIQHWLGRESVLQMRTRKEVIVTWDLFS